MPTRRLDEPRSPLTSEWDNGPCTHPEHNPPSHMVFQPGRYEHTCPSCGKKTVFTVPSITV